MANVECSAVSCTHWNLYWLSSWRINIGYVLMIVTNHLLMLLLVSAANYNTAFVHSHTFKSFWTSELFQVKDTSYSWRQLYIGLMHVIYGFCMVNPTESFRHNGNSKWYYLLKSKNSMILHYYTTSQLSVTSRYCNAYTYVFVCLSVHLSVALHNNSLKWHLPNVAHT